MMNTLAEALSWMTLNWMIPGKADFNDIYDADDPRPYYTTIQTLDYQLKWSDLFKKLQRLIC